MSTNNVAVCDVIHEKVSIPSKKTGPEVELVFNLNSPSIPTCTVLQAVLAMATIPACGT